MMAPIPKKQILKSFNIPSLESIQYFNPIDWSAHFRDSVTTPTLEYRRKIDVYIRMLIYFH